MVERKGANWSKLWSKLRDAATAAGDDRMVAVLDNHSDSKESICRKLTVVKEADVHRVVTARTKRASRRR